MFANNFANLSEWKRKYSVKFLKLVKDRRIHITIIDHRSSSTYPSCALRTSTVWNGTVHKWIRHRAYFSRPLLHLTQHLILFHSEYTLLCDFLCLHFIVFFFIFCFIKSTCKKWWRCVCVCVFWWLFLFVCLIFWGFWMAQIDTFLMMKHD